MDDRLVADLIDTKELRDPKFQSKVNRLRKVDNFTSWFYIAREYLYFLVVLGGSVAFYHIYDDLGLTWWWLIPVGLVTVFLVGLGQHRLVMLAHEASHYLLFKNWKLNELVSNWFCLYPMWSMTHNYRLQHLAHHQYTNDPERDPDLIYMQATGQRFQYPMPVAQFFWDCVVRLLFWVPGLVHFVVIRAKYANLGGVSGPYKPREKPSVLVPGVHFCYLVLLIGNSGLAAILGSTGLLLFGTLGLLAALLVFDLLVPASWYMQTIVKPVIPQHWASYQRNVYFAVLFVTLGYLPTLTGEFCLTYIALYIALWVVPLFTTFAFFMILREDIQHSNTAQQKFRDTRNFEGNPLIKWSLFPLNMDYHLSHHIFPLVPHYNLPKLEELLLETEVYRRCRILVKGYLLPHREDADDADARSTASPSLAGRTLRAAHTETPVGVE